MAIYRCEEKCKIKNKKEETRIEHLWRKQK
jgi:hypothetical protein